MPLPLPNLDDRRFDDLVAEARERLQRHLPELAQIAPGDPVHALVDVFAWMTETVLYRANLIPERQRRAFLNLLQLPLRPAVAARGLVCVDAQPRPALPPRLPAETALAAGEQAFSTVGELQPTPLALDVLVKERLGTEALEALGVTEAQLRAHYGTEVDAFRPRLLRAGEQPLSLAGTLDQAFYLALSVPKALKGRLDSLRGNLAGTTLNVGLAPFDEAPADLARMLPPRALEWSLAWRDESDTLLWLPLEVADDSSRGGRRAGVARLRLPRDPALLRAPLADDPKFAGYGDSPPEPPAHVAPERMAFWLRLRCPAEPGLTLGYLGVNAVDVVGQAVARDRMLGVGSGRPEQVVRLAHGNVDPGSLELQVEETGAFRTWRPVDHFAASGPEDRVYRLDPATGEVQFGDGLRGRRPAANKGIRALVYRHGGGAAGNLSAQSITELRGADGRYRLRHEWPTRGGVDAETVAEAEQRIPAFLSHRDRAVTREDFARLARDNPVNPVARAEAKRGFLPGANLDSVRREVPGVVSVFVLPPRAPAVGGAPRPTAGLLTDVFAYLSERTLVGTELYVLSPEFVPVALAAAVQVLDPQTERETLAAVRGALLEYLWALAPGGPQGTGWPLGRALDVNELRTVAGRVEGVLSVTGLDLYHRPGARGAWQRLSGGEHLPLKDYQLPELVAMTATAGAEPRAPETVAGPPLPEGPQPVPVPVIPDIC